MIIRHRWFDYDSGLCDGLPRSLPKNRVSNENWPGPKSRNRTAQARYTAASSQDDPPWPRPVLQHNAHRVISIPISHPSLSTILTRALAIWLILICAEVLHGIARAALLVPHVGMFRSNQIGVFTGSTIILVIALIFVRWIGATRPAQLLMVGLVWLGLTVAFEILFGRFVVGLTWERLAADYNVPEGGLMPLGLLVLLLSPLIAATMRRSVPTG